MREDENVDTEALNTLWEAVLSDHRYILGQIIEMASMAHWLIDNDPRLDEDTRFNLAKATSLTRSLPGDMVSYLIRMEYELNSVKNYRISGGKK